MIFYFFDFVWSSRPYCSCESAGVKRPSALQFAPSRQSKLQTSVSFYRKSLSGIFMVVFPSADDGRGSGHNIQTERLTADTIRLLYLWYGSLCLCISTSVCSGDDCVRWRSFIIVTEIVIILQENKTLDHFPWIIRHFCITALSFKRNDTTVLW